jgi:hypothetical protein
VLLSLSFIVVEKDATPLGQISTMRINDGGGVKSMVLDPYDIKGTLLKVQECTVSMDDELANTRKNRSCNQV